MLERGAGIAPGPVAELAILLVGWDAVTVIGIGMAGVVEVGVC